MLILAIDPGPEESGWFLHLPMLARPKKRPRFAAGQGAYHESSYAAWLSDARREVLLQWRRPPLDCPVRVDVAFEGPRRPRGDEDNLRGAVLDALGGSGHGDGIVLLDDRLSWGGETSFAAGPEHRILIEIRRCDPPNYGPYRMPRRRPARGERHE